MQMKKCLTYVQGKNVKVSDYKDSVRVQFNTTMVQAGEFPYGTSGLKMSVKEDNAISPQADDRLKWWSTCRDKVKKASLNKKAYNFDMALIYLNGCNSNEMRTDFAKVYGNGHGNYPQTLEEVYNVHWTIYSKPTKKQKSSISDHSLKSDDVDDDNNKKKDHTTEDEGNLVTAHIARYDQMDKYEQVLVLINDGYGQYDLDYGFSHNIIGLHVTNINIKYELDNVQPVK